MRNVQWLVKGLSRKSRRVLNPSDFDRLGVDCSDTLVWSPENNHTIEMSNKASDSLVAALPTEFAIVDPNDGAKSSQDESSQDDDANLDSSPKSPEGDGNASGDASPS